MAALDKPVGQSGGLRLFSRPNLEAQGPSHNGVPGLVESGTSAVFIAPHPLTTLAATAGDEDERGGAASNGY